MTSDPFDGFLKTRRAFLRSTLLGAAASWTVPAFVQHTFASMARAAAGSATAPATGKDSPILVLVQLAGGNDGLNTVVPVTDDAYHRARRRLALGKRDTLALTDDLALNNNLPFLHRQFNNGRLAILQGVGYPNPNRSHFRSTEIWTRATDADKHSATGWIGRYFDNACAGADPETGIALTDRLPDAFVAEKRPGIAFKTPDLYQWIQGGDDAETAGLFRSLNAPDSETGGASINMVDGGNMGTALASADDALGFLERTALDATVSSDKIRSLLSRSRVARGYPGTPLGQSLQMVARMIQGGLSTRVYYVSHGGFDTHANQANAHNTRLKQLDDALAAFHKDIESHESRDRVLIMTFSEFGRRVAENAAGGTDHGAAAPLFVLGRPAKGGLYGTHPSLTDLDRGDLKHHTDFRSAYATLLESWLQTPSTPILGRPFPTLDFI